MYGITTFGFYATNAHTRNSYRVYIIDDTRMPTRLTFESGIRDNLKVPIH